MIRTENLPVKVKFTKRFSKQYDKTPPKIKKAFQERLVIFIHDKFDPRLHNHVLTGKYKSYRSINITGDWRAIFIEDTENTICFEMLGTHSQLYG